MNKFKLPKLGPSTTIGAIIIGVITTIIINFINPFIPFPKKHTKEKTGIETTFPVANKKDTTIIIIQTEKPHNNKKSEQIHVDQIPTQPIHNKAKVMKGRVMDTNGVGLPNVKVWCENCSGDCETMTDENGRYSLKIDFEIKDPMMDQLVIMFSYKNQEDKRIVHYKNLVVEPLIFER
jgi:hypothetical protein